MILVSQTDVPYEGASKMEKLQRALVVFNIFMAGFLIGMGIMWFGLTYGPHRLHSADEICQSKPKHP
jgi:hypothetical protein